MSEWNAMTFEAKDNLLRVVRREAEGMFAMAEQPEAWERATMPPGWEVRDVIGHLVDVPSRISSPSTPRGRGPRSRTRTGRPAWRPG